MAGKYYWIKERHNPQFDNPHYTAYGRIAIKRAIEIEKGTLYGTNFMLRFDTQEEYKAELKKLNISE